MNKTDLIKNYCRQLKLSAIPAKIDGLLQEAEKKDKTHLDFAQSLLGEEIQQRQENDAAKRKKAAHLPAEFDLNLYDFSVSIGLSKKNLAQLRELKWLEQNFNVILMGPSGTGKTYIAAGLCFDAIKNGYRAYFKSMEEIINILKFKDMTRSATADYKRLLRAHLIIIDDIMLFPIAKNEAVAFFNFINTLFDKAAFIITTNKSPKEWALLIDDEVLTTALLDRILYKCEIINLEGNSYRMKNRKTIFQMN